MYKDCTRELVSLSKQEKPTVVEIVEVGSRRYQILIAVLPSSVSLQYLSVFGQGMYAQYAIRRAVISKTGWSAR